MATRRAARPTCCCRSGRRPGRICSPGRCWLSNCSGRRRSLRTTPIIVKDRAVLHRLALLIAASPLLLAAASAPVSGDAEPVDSTLARARAEARHAENELRRLEQAAGKARDEAAKLAAERRAA